MVAVKMVCHIHPMIQKRGLKCKYKTLKIHEKLHNETSNHFLYYRLARSIYGSSK